MNVNTFKNYVKVATMGQAPFYADELGLKGGEISYLARLGIVEPTGITKIVTITHSWRGLDGEKKTDSFEVEAKQWRFVPTSGLIEDHSSFSAFCKYFDCRCARQQAKSIMQNIEGLKVLAYMTK